LQQTKWPVMETKQWLARNVVRLKETCDNRGWSTLSLWVWWRLHFLLTDVGTHM